jgi:hypothetical protein
MIRTAALAWALLAAPFAVAQETFDPGTIEIQPLEDPQFQPPPPEAANRDIVDLGQGAVIRALDKVSGDVVELSLRNGETTAFGLIEIALGECRYPRGNPAGDAYAWIEVRTPARGTTDFEGWMIASSPALNALDHARYDVWVMRCISA